MLNVLKRRTFMRELETQFDRDFDRDFDCNRIGIEGVGWTAPASVDELAAGSLPELIDGCPSDC